MGEVARVPAELSISWFQLPLSVFPCNAVKHNRSPILLSLSFSPILIGPQVSFKDATRQYKADIFRSNLTHDSSVIGQKGGIWPQDALHLPCGHGLHDDPRDVSRLGDGGPPEEGSGQHLVYS